tara:strand:- start:166 stop:1140 length:975 start_codon:yes stop_codon:yes gene_type:complete
MSFNGDLYPESGASVVMTTKGDMVDYNTARQRLAIGSANQILQVKSGLPSWETLSTAGSVLTTQGDILYEGASALARLGQSTNYHTLATKGAGANPAWQASATSTMTAAQDILYSSSANTLARLAAGTDGDVLTTHSTGSAPTWETPSGSASLAYIGEVKLGSPAAFIEQTTGFDDYSNVMMFFNLAESGTGTFIPMCQFYVGGSLATGTSYGTSEIINAGSIAKTNATTKVMLDGNSTSNNSCTGYLSFFTGSSNSGAQTPSDYTTVQGQYQLGLGSTSDAPDTQAQVCAKYTGIIQGCRITNEGTSTNFGGNSAIKMFGVTY